MIHHLYIKLLHFCKMRFHKFFLLNFCLTVKQGIFSLLGVIAEVYPVQMSAYADRLLNVYISTLNQQVRKSLTFILWVCMAYPPRTFFIRDNRSSPLGSLFSWVLCVQNQLGSLQYRNNRKYNRCHLMNLSNVCLSVLKANNY